MPRSLWRGSLSFGLVNVPVALMSATRDRDVHFHQLHADSKARLEVKRVCKKGGHEAALPATHGVRDQLVTSRVFDTETPPVIRSIM